jgi:signal transduction histidine kinase
MSLRRRLLVVLALAVAVLLAGFATLGFALSSSEGARVDEAQNVTRDVADELAATRLRGPEADPALVARATLRGQPQVRGGFCGRDGAVPIVVRGGRRNAKAGATLSPDEHGAIGSACRESPAQGVFDKWYREPHEVVVVSTASVGVGGEVAWAAVFVRSDPPGGVGWRASAIVLAAGTLLLAMVVVGAIASLRKGAWQLERGISRLERDLRAPIDEPHATELAAIARAVSAMARHLADARDTEKRLSGELAHAQRLSALGRVVAGVAHEVRNPLAGLKLRLDLMKRDPALGATARGDVETCLEEVERLDRVVRSLLTVGRREPRPLTSASVAAPIDLRLAGCLATAEERDVTLVRTGDATAQIDADALGQIVENLVRNAIEASPAGGTVRVAISRGEPENERVEVDVIDEGPGIPKARAAELFEPFFTTKAEGTGLGLWMSRALAEAMGGTLRYERVGASTRMRLELSTVAKAPTREGASAADHPQESASASAREGAQEPT